MIWEELNKKYGKKLIDRVFKGNSLRGYTYTILPDGKEDYLESYIINAIKEINCEKITDWN